MIRVPKQWRALSEGTSQKCERVRQFDTHDWNQDRLDVGLGEKEHCTGMIRNPVRDAKDALCCEHFGSRREEVRMKVRKPKAHRFDEIKARQIELFYTSASCNVCTRPIFLDLAALLHQLQVRTVFSMFLGENAFCDVFGTCSPCFSGRKRFATYSERFSLHNSCDTRILLNASKKENLDQLTKLHGYNRAPLVISVPIFFCIRRVLGVELLYYLREKKDWQAPQGRKIMRTRSDKICSSDACKTNDRAGPHFFMGKEMRLSFDLSTRCTP